VLAELGLVKSRGEARRLIEQGGVRLNGEPVESEEVAAGEVAGGLLQVGKRRFVRFKA
jgi:tyrosyl-tRNA synthetase